MFDKAVTLAVKWPAVATYGWTAKDSRFVTEILDKSVPVNGLADTKLTM
jgi:hypothetical protein